MTTPEQSPPTTAASPKAPSIEESSSKTTNLPPLSVGDLVIRRCPTDISRHKLFLVTSVTASGVYIIEPKYSYIYDIGRFTIDGQRCTYIPFSAKQLWHPSETRCAAPSLLPPPAADETLFVNPSGPEAIEQYWGVCPFCAGKGLFCPGCGVAFNFDYLVMSCGQLMACPVCHGFRFAEGDKAWLKWLERYPYPMSKALKKVRNEDIGQRCGRIDERRKELGLEPLKWGPLEEEEEEGEGGMKRLQEDGRRGAECS